MWFLKPSYKSTICSKLSFVIWPSDVKIDLLAKMLLEKSKHCSICSGSKLPQLKQQRKTNNSSGRRKIQNKKCSGVILKKEKKVGGNGKSWRKKPFLWGPQKNCSLFNAKTETQKYKEQKYKTSNPWKCEPQFSRAVSTHIKGVQWKRPPHSWQPLNAKDTLGGGDLFLTMGLAMCHKGGLSSIIHSAQLIWTKKITLHRIL